jgi:acyl carrier protein
MNRKRTDITPVHDLTEKVITIASETLGRKKNTLKKNEPLFSMQSGFSSFTLMEFVLELEKAFDLSIPDEELDPDIFHSVESIVVYLQAKLKKKH